MVTRDDLGEWCGDGLMMLVVLAAVGFILGIVWLLGWLVGAVFAEMLLGATPPDAGGKQLLTESYAVTFAHPEYFLGLFGTIAGVLGGATVLGALADVGGDRLRAWREYLRGVQE